MSTKTRAPDVFHQLSERNQQWVVRLITLVITVLLWELVGQVLGNLFFAPITDVIPSYVEMATEGEMFSALAVTLWEMFIGFGLAVIVAIPIGLVMGRNRVVEQALSPWVSAMFVTATAALLPLFVILFGISFDFRIAIVWISCVWFILLNTHYGAKGVDQEFTDVGTSFNAGRIQMFQGIVLPATLPFIFAGLRMGLIHALRGVILAQTFIEFGYGGLIAQMGKQSVDTAPILALILTLMFLGYGLRILLEKTEAWLFPWSEETEAMGAL
ncbi:ABC transporter permease [Halorarum salinum]|uniref:ABC transporter permease subunit n=1 Tax=Halorarum salinum TaxID=2743089 RepID=A0A7D5L8S3_9EURY|nr:ABC transporter permease subunit [Halobaculum salinum]QLG60329.1 ABC transporter permease subunit [Halobaculum salinum]